MRFVRLVMAAVLVIPFLGPVPSIGADAPTQIVEDLNAQLLAVMKEGEKLGYVGRYSRLAPTITATFDLPLIARIVVGRYWRTFSDEEKAEFVDTFTRLSIATYAHHFDDYSGECFKVVSSKAAHRGRIMVKSLLIKPHGEKVELDYILYKKSNEWRVVNVIADGVSDLSLKRADYTSFLKKKGTNAFFDKLNEKISRYSE